MVVVYDDEVLMMVMQVVIDIDWRKWKHKFLDVFFKNT